MIINLSILLNLFVEILALKFFDSDKLNPGPRVTVKQGILEGTYLKTDNGVEYSGFQGIPYGKPPIGDLRFANPQPPENWDGILDATEEGSASMQYDAFIMKAVYGDEDCLYLNLFAPKDSGEKVPVFVYFHGGGHFSGSSVSVIYGPDNFIEKNVIIITLNFRLGIFGFLTLNTPGTPGNVGIKDQLMALKWINENIANFGGDPNNVIIFGESSGSESVQLHMLSPQSKGLFHKVILQSGSAINTWSFQDDPESKAFKLAEILGVKSTDKSEVENYFKNAPAKDLLMAAHSTEFSGRMRMAFCPSVEHDFPDSFLTRHPKELMRAKEFVRVPAMAGLHNSDGLVFLLPIIWVPEHMEDLRNNKIPDLRKFVPDELVAKFGEDGIEPVKKKIQDYYFSGDNVTESYVKLIGDYCFAKDVIKSLKIFAEFSPTYYYRFSYSGSINSVRIFSGMEYSDAGHADELGYMFKFAGFGKRVGNDALVTERVIQMWTNFAKFGDPTPELNDVITTKWNPVDPASPMCMNINVKMELIPDPFADRCSFWEEVYNM